jgi:Tol biopolymer transport system component
MSGKYCWWLLSMAFLVPMFHLQSHLSFLMQAVSTPPVSAVSPQIFAPGVISGPANDGSPAFAPDGNTLFFTRSAAHWTIILESHKTVDHRTGESWSEPQVAPFSGEWPDSSPAMSPDGSFLVFNSLRPVAAAASAENPQGAARVANLWRINRVRSGWSTPVRLPDTVNIGHSIWKPSIAADGSIYFVSINKEGKKRLYSSRYKNGTYEQAQPLSFSDGDTSDVDPEIAPDESFLVFCSSGRTPGDQKDHLFIVLRKAGEWGPVMPMLYAGDDANGSSTDDEPRLSPDHLTIYFSSDRSVPVKFPRSPERARQDLQRLNSWDNSNSNVWFMPVSSWLNPQ